ncbi:MAG: peptidoglycan-binding domain-containing protein [Beijerinckiaceae bacterium]
MPDRNASAPTLTMDRILEAREPARKLMRGETTITRLAVKLLAKNPLSSLTWLASGFVTLAIVVNVTLLQPERHRAPMFVGNPMIHQTPQLSQTPLPPQRPPQLEREMEALRKAELQREIQQELSKRGFLTGSIETAGSTRTVQAVREFQASANLPVTGQISEAVLASILTANALPKPASSKDASPKEQMPKDQILGLLRSTQDRLERPETVVAMQRALTKLGYGPLKDDGHFGTGTRTALDRFEKERRLPPRGENPARTLRELAQASGIAIE